MSVTPRVVIGGGINGLAVARVLQGRGHGAVYRPGLLKVRLCAARAASMAHRCAGWTPRRFRDCARAGGVRALAVDVDGALLDDFMVQAPPRQVHVLNAPSPAATTAPRLPDMLLRSSPKHCRNAISIQRL